MLSEEKSSLKFHNIGRVENSNVVDINFLKVEQSKWTILLVKECLVIEKKPRIR